MNALSVEIGSTGLEPRLEARYQEMVMAHLRAGETVAAGIKALPGMETSLATTQAVWRFLNNARVSLPALAEPLLAAAHAQAQQCPATPLLVMHDWSRLDFKGHASKADRLQMTHHNDVGYELQSSLLVEAQAGLPIAPVAQNLVTSTGVWSTRWAGLQPPQAHLDELGERLTWLEAQDFGRPLVHIIDREADSVAHLRRWHDKLWLIRAKEGSTAHFAGKSCQLKAIAAALAYTPAGPAVYKGKCATLAVAEADVVLTRTAKPSRLDPATGKRVAPIPGAPLPVRLIVARVLDASGALLAQWTLLSTVTAVAAATLARWYYWRWGIESFFKLLKSAGHHIEQWQQQNGGAVARRLLIASQACVTVWRLNLRRDAEAATARAFLARLSGRQIKPGKPLAPSALLDGLFSLLQTLLLLEHYEPDQLLRLARVALGASPGGEDV